VLVVLNAWWELQMIGPEDLNLLFSILSIMTPDE
jgi:hypothetical protein